MKPRKRIGRRAVLKGVALGAAGLLVSFHPLRKWWLLGCREGGPGAAAGFGPLRPDPNGILDLPEGFSYRVLGRKGDPMDDGYVMPGSPDGAGVFPTPDGGYRIVRNHELSVSQRRRAAFSAGNRPPAEQMYDPRCWGGTVTLELDRNLEVRRKFLSLAGTQRNCSGGVTPWGSWLSCEEAVETPASDPRVSRPHGYVFEVPAARNGLAEPLPLRAMGRFRREGVAFHPAGGEVYQTEDQEGGCFYKFVPARPGSVAEGRLFALKVRGSPGAELSNRGAGPVVIPGRPLLVEWVELEEPDPREDTLRLTAREKGAAAFQNLEGIVWEGEGVVFISTAGGARGLGQVWRYVPVDSETGTLTLVAEPGDKCDLFKPDNVALSPRGDLLITEDNRRFTRLVGLTETGGYYPFAYFSGGSSEELSGLAFSPDGRFLVVSAYEHGLTLLITGPFTGIVS